MLPPSDPRVALRAPAAEDAAAFVALRRASRSELEPFEAFPDAGPDPFSEQAFARFLGTADSPRRARFLVVRRADGALLGALSLTGIARGVLQSATLDYWLGTPHVGQGYMGEALQLALRHAFDTLGLQRVEALVLPGNGRSRRLLERSGFTLEGVARGAVRMRGEWRDHERWARLAGDV